MWTSQEGNNLDKIIKTPMNYLVSHSDLLS